MKKLLLLCVIFAMVMGVFADEVRRVAILETVDRQGNVSYASKLMLRSNLAKAITNTPGYEAYDRTDMDAIMGEQDFQRTGMVSNDQIKRLGEMTGAKYVLVAEAVIVDAANMYITAKLLDVETARTIMTDNQLMGTSAKEIQRGCQLLADKLIRPVATQSTTAKTTNTKPVKQEPSKPAKQEKPTPAPQPTPAPVQPQQPVVYSQPVPDAAMIVKISNKEYSLNGNTMDRKAYEKFIEQNCPEAWRKHRQADKTIKAGWAFFSMGIALTSMWGLLGVEKETYLIRRDLSYYDRYTSSYISEKLRSGEWEVVNDVGGTYVKEYYIKTPVEAELSAIILGSFGAGFTAMSIPLLGAGYHQKHNNYKKYNNNCAAQKFSSISLNLQASSNSLGLALHF